MSEVEPVVPPSTRSGSLITPVAGPIIWISHFFVVYLTAEARCTISLLAFDLADVPAAALVTVVLTVLAIVTIIWFGVGSWRRWRNREGSDVAEQGRVLGLVGLISGGVFALATLWVGVTVLILPQC